jgi:hypothetical protein
MNPENRHAGVSKQQFPPQLLRAKLVIFNPITPASDAGGAPKADWPRPCAGKVPVDDVIELLRQPSLICMSRFPGIFRNGVHGALRHTWRCAVCNQRRDGIPCANLRCWECLKKRKPFLSLGS